MKVFINPGHGGKDPGAVGNGLKEKDIALKISKKIVEQLKNYNLQIKMFRSKDDFKTLQQITNEANRWGADLFVSIHVNSGGGTGFESFIHTNVQSKTPSLQKSLHDNIMKRIKNYGVRDRGKKRQNLHVVRESRMPAVLTENMFIDSTADSLLLKDGAFINAVAAGHVDGIVQYTKAKKKGGANVSSNKKKYYRVVAGSFTSRKNAEDRIKKLNKNGYNDVFLDIFEK